MVGKFGDNTLARDIIDYGGLWANVKRAEAIYFVGQTDSSKAPLNGNNVYEIRFPANALPDTGGQRILVLHAHECTRLPRSG